MLFLSAFYSTGRQLSSTGRSDVWVLLLQTCVCWPTLGQHQVSCYERRRTMYAYGKIVLIVAAVAGLYDPSSALAQKSPGGVTGGARLHPGMWTDQRSPRSMMRARPMIRNTTPVITRSESDPNVVAQVPSERRSYSYEPSQESTANNDDGREATSRQAPTTVQRSMDARRSFSYEPSMESNSAPRMRSSHSHRTPKYLLQKTDPNKYRN
jgi:hypothetical protein